MDLARVKYCVEYIDKHPESLMNCNGVDMAYFIPDDVRGLIAEVEQLMENHPERVYLLRAEKAEAERDKYKSALEWIAYEANTGEGGDSRIMRDAAKEALK